jgi:hypothetical protein
MSTSEIATVLAWHDALNAGDLGTLEMVSSDDIEIGDARGAAQGLEALRSWAQRFSGPVQVGDLYVRDGVVVAALTLPDGGTEAAAFRVVHDHVTSVFRHPDLATALAATDLTEEDLDA